MWRCQLLFYRLGCFKGALLNWWGEKNSIDRHQNTTYVGLCCFFQQGELLLLSVGRLHFLTNISYCCSLLAEKTQQQHVFPGTLSNIVHRMNQHRKLKCFQIQLEPSTFPWWFLMHIVSLKRRCCRECSERFRICIILSYRRVLEQNSLEHLKPTLATTRRAL